MRTVQPRQFGDREGGNRHASDRCGPGGGTVVACSQLREQPVGVRRRFGVVPELGRMYRSIVGVERDHAVLLTADTDRGDR
jgi:hypothetical protein